LFRLAALFAVPLLLVGGVEVGLRLAGVGYPTGFLLEDRIQGKPVRVENQRFGWRFFPPEAARTPRHIVMEIPKPADTVRLFVLGESAALGDPDPDFSFGRILEVLLRDRFPTARFEVINAAMTAINSHAILPIARACARAEGDFWIVYAGNNEVIGPYGAGTVFGSPTPPWGVIRANLAFRSTRLGQVLEQTLRRLRPDSRPVDAWQGMELFLDRQVRREEPRMARVYHHFEKNLDAIVRLGLRSGARVIVSTVASNLRDCAPFGSQHRPGLAGGALQQWEEAYRVGAEREKAGQIREALEAYAEAAKVDDQYAELWYRMGRCHLALDRGPEARRCLIRARDQDTLRFRADSRLNEIVRGCVSNQPGGTVRLVDGEAMLDRQSPNGILGWEFLHEHVHFTFAGNYQLALAVADQVADQLPAARAIGAGSGRGWPSLEECQRQLAWTVLDRYETLETMRQRIELPPFTQQLNHEAHYRHVLDQIRQVEPLLSSNHLRQAVQVCQEAVARTPGDWALHQNLGELLQRIGDAPGAIAAFRRVIELVPDHEKAHYDLGNLLDETGRSEEAVVCFQTTLEFSPWFYEAYNGMALAQANLGRYEEAIRNYREALRLKPGFAAAHVNLGLALSRLGRIDEAKQHYLTALKLKPDSAGAYVNLGKILNSEGQHAAAVSNYLSALQFEPANALIHFNLANVLTKLGQNNEAIQHYTEAVRLKPDFTEARSQLGFEYARQNRQAEAMAQFAEVVRLDPDDAEAQLNLGVAFANQQDFDRAIHHFREALRIDPQYGTAQRYLDAALRRNPGR
jgi:tetratricopeptide (TPR) repeat protein